MALTKTIFFHLILFTLVQSLFGLFDAENYFHYIDENFPTHLLNKENLEGEITAATGLRSPKETHLANIKQLTFNGTNAEAYFSFDNKRIVFQATNFGSACDQIYEFDLSRGDMSHIPPRQISNGLGICTCSYFLPGLQNIILASTYNSSYDCPTKLCPRRGPPPGNKTLADLCNGTYTWDVFSSFEIYSYNLAGNMVKRFTDNDYYDAEATISPLKDKIVFTSLETGDLELYTMNIDGTGIKRITSALGYDGGAFFSPDGKRLVYRASRPTTPAAQQKYKNLLKWGLVSPTDMELFVADAEGKTHKQITHLGGASWAPFYHPDGKRIIFSSNYNASKENSFAFSLWMINEDGTNLQRITYDQTFDAFPMFSFDGKKLIFASTRNATGYQINLFIADWVDNPSSGNGAIRRIGAMILFVLCLTSAILANLRN